jgi:hypothetical protein
MNFDLLLENITNPALLFFIRYHRCSSKSDLEILKTPLNSSLFIFFFSIGFKGGQELSHSHFTYHLVRCIGVLIAIIIPFYVFLFLKNILALTTRRHCSSISVSAVTFVTAIFLRNAKLYF